MIDMIRELLEQEKIGLWRMTVTEEHCAELYFIRKKLDMPRIRDNVRCTVEVFRDFEADGKKCRGSSTAIVPSGAGKEEILNKLRAAYAAAAYVKNPWFEFADPVKEEEKKSLSPLKDTAPEATAVQVAKILLSEDRDEDAYINSAEIFVTRGHRHIVSSWGVDVAYGYDRIDGEFVTQCVSPVDVEQYRGFGWTSVDEEQIREKVREAIGAVRDRANAAGLPDSGRYPVLLKGEMLTELFNYYLDRAGAPYVAAGYSDWKAGKQVQTPEEKGEPLNLRVASNEPYSPEGIPMPERLFVENGTLRLIHGPTRFCRYAGAEPVGGYRKILCDNGTADLGSMRSEGVLEPVFFSDFQMDAFDGHFKGEIRLAYLHHADGTREILTGGSVNGSLPELQGRMIFSRDRYASLEYEGPMAVLLPDVAVAGK